MKKIIIILSAVLLIILIGLGVFYFLGNGKEKFSDFFTDNTFGSFFDTEPKSQNDLVANPTDSTNITPTNTDYVAPVLRQISFEPVSGYTFYSTSSTSTTTSLDDKGIETVSYSVSTSTAVRFQERASGHMYDVFEFIEAPQKILSETNQKIYSTLFSKDRNQFIYQTLSFNNEQIVTTFGKILFSTSTPTTLQSNSISGIVSDFIYNKEANKLIYSIKEGGVSNIYTSTINRTDEKFVITLPFNEFLIESINANEVLITTKASQSIPGYSYILNITNGSFTKILGDIPGLLVKVSPDKKYYIYSESTQSQPIIRSYNTTTRQVSLGAIDTIPEKCVFSQKNTSELYCFGSVIYKTGQYPDDWYKGKIFNSESLFKINLDDTSISTIYNFESNGLSFDVINPTLTTNNDFLLFQDKYTLTLWSLDLRKIENSLF
jgi:hypothetical protein